MRGNSIWLEQVEWIVSSLSCSTEHLLSTCEDYGTNALCQLRAAVNELVMSVAQACDAGYSRQGRAALHRSHSQLQTIGRLVDKIGRLPQRSLEVLRMVREQVVEILIGFKLALQSGLHSRRFEEANRACGAPTNNRALLRPWTSLRPCRIPLKLRPREVIHSGIATMARS